MPSLMNRLAARTLGAMPLAEPLIPARFASDSRPRSPLLEERPTLRPEVSKPSVEMRSNEMMPAVRPEFSTPEQPDRTKPLQEHLAPPAAVPLAKSAISYAEPRYSFDDQSLPYAALGDRPSPPLGVERDSAAITPRQTQQEAAAAFPEPTSSMRSMAPREQLRNATNEPLHLNAAQNAAQPSIHVTIGRIDVRAEIASAQPSQVRTQPKSSALSLQQFLKQEGLGAR